MTYNGKIIVNAVCSFGFNCHSAYFLRTNGLKKQSYPFDWIMSNLQVVKDCIENDFNDYLNKSLYISNNDKSCGHNKYCYNMFPHHNPLLNMDHYDYFVRCVNRFKTLLSQQNIHKLFIISIINEEHDINSVETRHNFVKFNTFLKNYTSNYTLLIIINYPNKKTNTFNLIKNSNLIFLEITTLSSNTGTEYSNKTDNDYLNSLFQRMFIIY
jgi:hypothetical protein